MNLNIRAIFANHANVNLYDTRYGIRIVTRYADHRYWTITFSHNGEPIVWKAYNLNELCALYSDALYIARRNARTR